MMSSWVSLGNAYQVDIIRLHLPQACLHGNLHALRVVPDEIGLDFRGVVHPVGRGVLGSEDDLIAHAAHASESYNAL